MLKPSGLLEDEAKHVGALVKAPPILAAGATVERVLARVEHAPLLHLSVFSYTWDVVSLTGGASSGLACLQLSQGPSVHPPADRYLSSLEV